MLIERVGGQGVARRGGGKRFLPDATQAESAQAVQQRHAAASAVGVVGVAASQIVIMITCTVR